MCPIQKGLRPQFSAFPNKAPFQLNSRKASSRSSSQERPFLRPQLIKPRYVWAPPLCQAWNLSFHSLAPVRVQCSLPSSWKAHGLGGERGVRLLPSKSSTALFDTPQEQCRSEQPRASLAFGITSQNTVWLSCLLSEMPMPLLLSPLPAHLFPGFASIPTSPHRLLSQICFSAELPQWAV